MKRILPILFTLINILINVCTAQAQCAGDVNSPSANCFSNITLPLDTFGTSNLFIANIDNGSTDNCGITSFSETGTGLSAINYTCANIGNNVLNVTISDAAGNTATCVTVVQVIDNTAPTPDCYNTPVQVYLNGSGSVSVPAIALDSNSTDNCGIVTRLINNAASQQYTCANIATNPQTATLTIRDASNNTATCTAQIEVLDILPPTANCRNITVNLNTVDTVEVNASQINSQISPSFDNCGNISLLINGQTKDTFTCADVGINTAVLKVTDASGNVSTCNANITVQDVSIPSATCTNPTVYLDNNGQVTLQATSVATATDNCSVISFAINGQPSVNYDCTDVGSFHSETVVITDGGGNTATCNAFITVEDTISPVALCNNITIQLDSFGNDTVTAIQLGLPNSYDNCGIASLFIAGSPYQTFTCTDIGINNILVSVTDSSGNTSTCVSTVTIEDQIGPVALCNTPIPTQLGANGTVEVCASSIDAGSTDACGPLTLSFINGQTCDTFNCSNVGNNPVILVVEDANGNTSYCQSIIQISDAMPPDAQCQPLTVYLNNAGSVTVQDIALNNGSTDNCYLYNFHINTISTSSINYNCATVGVDTVLFIVQDAYANFDTCITTVTIVDTTAPQLSVTPTISVNLSNTGPFALTPADVNANATDACGIDTMFITPNNISCDDAGTLVAVTTAVDIHGNISTATTIITLIIETATPTSTATTVCEGDTINLWANPPAGTYTYAWTGPNGYTSTLENPEVTTNSDASHIGWYYLQITPVTGNGCSGMDSLFLSVVTQPSLSGNSLACLGTTETIEISNLIDYQGLSPNFEWFLEGISLGNNADSLEIGPVLNTDIGNYTVEINIGACTLLSDSFFFNAVSCVWPGDTDDETHVNNMDVLPICLGFGTNGWMRPNATTNWQGQPAVDWSISPAIPGINDYKFLDTDGNGSIELADVEAIGLNYQESYIRSGTVISNTDSIPFFLGDMTTSAGQHLEIPIYLGDNTFSADSVYAIAFSITYDVNYVDTNLVSINFDDCWLRQTAQDTLIEFFYNLPSNGRIDAAVGRTDQQSVSGYGKLGVLNITIIEDVLHGAHTQDLQKNNPAIELNFAIENVRLITPQNQEKPTRAVSNNIQIQTGLTTITQNAISLAPNPTQGQVTLHSSSELLHQVFIYDALGRLVQNQLLGESQKVQLDVSHLPQGIYRLAVQTDKGLQQTSFIKE